MDIIEMARQRVKEESKRAGKENKPIEVSSVETPTHLVEEIKKENGELVFVIFNKKTGDIEKDNAKKFEYGELTFVPSQDDVFKKDLIRLPSTVEFVSEEKINEIIREFIGVYNWLDEKTYFLGTNYAKYTWIYNLYWTVPFYGPWGQPGTGKTRHIDTIGALCRKPLWCSGAVSEAFIYRMMDLHGPTLVINEFDRLNADDQSLLVAILNNSYEKNHPITKMEGEGKNMRPKLWQVFGPKIFSTIDRFKSDALESRTIRISSQEFPKEERNNYPIELSEEFFEWARDIHNKLIGFRFNYFASHQRVKERVRVMAEKETDSQKLRLLRASELDILEQGQKREKFIAVGDFDNRTRQTFYPLLRVIQGKDIDTFINYARQYQDELVEQRSADEIGVVVNTTLKLADEQKKGLLEHVFAKDVRLEASKELYGVDKDNKPLKEISPQQIGAYFRKLKIKTDDTGKKHDKYLLLDDKLLDSLKSRYSPRSKKADSQTRREANSGEPVEIHAQNRLTSQLATDSPQNTNTTDDDLLQESGIALIGNSPKTGNPVLVKFPNLEASNEQ